MDTPSPALSGSRRGPFSKHSRSPCWVEEDRMAHLMSVHGTNRVIRVQADQTILDAALASGVDYPHGCRSGRCGACKTRLLNGDVEMLAHTRFALSDAERQDGYILACRAVPRTSGSILLPGQDEVPPEHPRQNL